MQKVLWEIEMIFSNFKIEIEKITNKFLDKLEIENRNIFQRRRTSRFLFPEGQKVPQVTVFCVSFQVYKVLCCRTCPFFEKFGIHFQLQNTLRKMSKNSPKIKVMTRIYAKFEQNILCTSYQSQSSALFMHFLKD